LIYLGGLAQISEAVHDSARIDGCTGLKRIFLIDLPLVLGQVRLQTIMSVIGAITAFDRILVLTNGGPGFATMVPAMDMYQSAFVSNQFGYAAAIGVLLFLFAMLLTIVTNRLIRPINEDVHR
jgi:ABC-type sugar transport system permease subunit